MISVLIYELQEKLQTKVKTDPSVVNRMSYTSSTGLDVVLVYHYTDDKITLLGSSFYNNAAVEILTMSENSLYHTTERNRIKNNYISYNGTMTNIEINDGTLCKTMNNINDNGELLQLYTLLCIQEELVEEFKALCNYDYTITILNFEKYKKTKEMIDNE